MTQQTLCITTVLMLERFKLDLTYTLYYHYIDAVDETPTFIKNDSAYNALLKFTFSFFDITLYRSTTQER